MVGRHATDFMFCDLCGSMLSMKALTYAECPCGFKRSIEAERKEAGSFRGDSDISMRKQTMNICTPYGFSGQQILGSASFFADSLAKEELQGKETSYRITAEDIRRALKIPPFVQLDKFTVAEAEVERATVNEACPQCRHPQLEYYTKQLRSADEGQTVFYECPNCRHKFSHNT